MTDFQITLSLIVLAVAIIVIAIRLRRTTSVGGTVRLKDDSGDRLSIDQMLEKELASAGSSKPAVKIAMTTRRVGGGNPESTEVITIDGQTYHSVDEIPPDVRDRVRTLLSQARASGSQPGSPNNAALVRIENDLSALGLDLREPPESSEKPPSAG